MERSQSHTSCEAVRATTERRKPDEVNPVARPGARPLSHILIRIQIKRLLSRLP